MGIRLPFLLVAALTGCAAAPTADPALTAELDRIFAEYAGGQGPGCAVGVARDGRILATRGYGIANLDTGEPIGPATAMDIGSISKQFTAVAALLLEQRGALPLDDSVHRWISGLSGPLRTVKVRDLLQHTSGLRDYNSLSTLSDRPVVTNADFLALMRRQQGLNFPAGSRHEYSHSDYELLGAVIEAVTKEPLGDFLAREIWVPAGMRSTRLAGERGRAIPGRASAYARDSTEFRLLYSTSRVTGGSEVYTTVEDLLRWGMLADGDDQAWLARLAERPRLHGDSIPYAHGLWTGRHRGLRSVTRGGGGSFHTRLLRFPAQRVTIVTLCNSPQSDPWGLSRKVAEYLLADAMEPAAPVPEPVAAPADELQRFVGDYFPPGDPWNYNTIEVHDGGLRDTFMGEVYPLVRLPDGSYTDRVFGYHFREVPGGIELEFTGAELPQVLVRRPDGPRWAPSGAQLAACAGTFASTELDAVWIIELEAGRLVMRRPGREAVPLEPIERDLFRGGFPEYEPFAFGVRFTRGTAGQVTEFLVTATPHFEIARDLRFTLLRTSP